MNGIDCFFEGWRLITRPGLRRYVVIPFVINALVLAGVVAYGVSRYDAWTAVITGWLPEWLSFLSGIFAFIAGLFVFVVMLYLFTIIANLVSSPFNAILSVRVETLLTGRTPSSDAGLFTVIVRAIGREFSKLIYLLPRLIGLLLVTVIPLLNTVSPFLWILFGAWMMAVEYVDFAADNNELTFAELRTRLSGKRGDAILFGALVYFALAIPLLNLLLIPAAVAGGTVFWVQHLRK